MMKSTVAFGAIVALTGAAGAAVVNVDFNGNPTGGDVTHFGDDGALSSPGGTLWNGVPTPSDAFDIPDEFGNPTDVDVIAGNVSGGTDPIANDLQDSGASGEFLITGLDPAISYTLAVYTATGGGFIFTDASGDSFWFFADPGPDASLPGDEIVGNVGDYFLISGAIPKDLGGGVFGFEFSTDGIVTGLQIVPAPGAAALAALGGLAMARRRRR